MDAEYWMNRYPHLPVAFWQLISGLRKHPQWTEGVNNPKRGYTRNPISPWHQQVGLKVEHYRMMVPGLTERNFCQQLNYSRAKYRQLINGQYPLLLADLEHLSDVTGHRLDYWLPKKN